MLSILWRPVATCCGPLKKISCLAAQLSICLAASLPGCLASCRGIPGAQIELFELPVWAGVHFGSVQGDRWARRLSALWRPVAGCGAELWPL